jgi:transketolase
MTEALELPRDVFIETIRTAAKRDRNIVFLCCDLGAKALDSFRLELGPQYIHTGISEQSMMDVAAGLALNGKKVYTYAMAPFITTRCYEQIKVALATMNLPVTIIGVGVGYGYDDAGPTHYGTDDLACMRVLGGIEILTPADTHATREAAHLTYQRPGLRYIRLDRAHLPDVYPAGDRRLIDDGLVEIEKGDDTCIVAHGYMLQYALKVSAELKKTGTRVGVIDAFRIKPIDGRVFQRIFRGYRRVVTVEEHFLSGGLGSVVLEGLADAGLTPEVRRIGIHDKYFFENGGRAHLHKLAGIDIATLRQCVSGEKNRAAA